jgi:1,4-alpha-glucan branching enzyme
LKYPWLGDFDQDIVNLTKLFRVFTQRMPDLRLLKEPEKVIAFRRKGLLFAFNFHPSKSYTNVLVPVSAAADYTIELSSDDTKYGGQGLVERMTYQTKVFDGQHFVELYLPARTAIVLKEKPHRKSKKKS